MRVVRYTAMPPATVPLSAAQRITRRVLTLLIVGVLVAACGLSFLRLRHIDPRGRAAWSGAPLVFSGSPREFTVWLPACDVRAIILHPGPGSTGHLAIDYFRRTLGPRGEPRTTGASGTTIRVSGSRPVRLRMDDGVAAGWREALTLSVRLEDGFGGPPPVGSSVALEPRRPITLEMFDHAWFGNLACAFDAGSDARTWTVVIATVVVMGGIGLLAAAWGSRARAPATAWTLDLLAAGRLPLVALLVGATTVTYALVVPPFEPPDELAHLQYARYVATTGGLPRDVPSPDSEWRASSYEWVQQPLYYLGAAAVLRATGLHAAAPQLRLNARSRLQAQGTEPTIYQHAEPTGDRTGHRALALLRAVSALMAVATAWLVARLAFRVTDDPVVVTTVAGGLALIPQWCAVMGAVSTDPPATLLAAAATLAVVRLALERITPARLLTTGLLIGAAYAVKATAAFLVPMAGAACLIATFTPVTPLLTTPRSTRWRTLAIRLVWIGVGIVLVAGWIPLRAWLLYGDPQAFEFKRRILEAGGFVPTPGPMPWTAEFWA
ncbi:MAG TPA: hypothetical protein VMF13_00410, partial [Luteitalea sp.]|nr:hypothetical protein [Luteitalea sp.]